MEEHLGTRIRMLREHQRIPVAELAAKAGISRQYLYLIERGIAADPGVQAILVIANVLGTTTDYLLKGTPKPRRIVKDLLGETRPTLPGMALETV